MYQIGDLIVYDTTGVCHVTDIRKHDLLGTGQERLYYVLKPLFQECVISTPVDNTKVFMRPVISRDEAERLIDSIPSIHVKPYESPVLRELTTHYDAFLKAHDCAALVELTMSIFTKKQTATSQNKKLGAVDEKYLKRGEDLLFGELSAALQIEKDRVPEYIEARVAGEAAAGSHRPASSPWAFSEM
ncbi:CarD family transcriptional regulator [Anaerotalea alkaliphila]|uniref:CarD-like/TRCF RNAP-interacting domain-containing protein n=1 Tax=Anaerotalea alkaliphila TaxID=2662126 RepID=A0A7X5HXB5_9FIRM|nr:CarD family transcriptional regulator [Anaerotalea alkaliphila]NDL68333.1 hypothetical protein [Anaerotalea alkaliphila]